MIRILGKDVLFDIDVYDGYKKPSMYLTIEISRLLRPTVLFAVEMGVVGLNCFGFLYHISGL